MSFKRFIISKAFFLHLLILLLVGVLLFFFSSQLLKKYTHHGKEYSLPNYHGMPIHNLDINMLSHDHEFIIMDSIFVENQLPGTIISQNPSPGSRVKKGRTVYVTVVAKNPEKIKMPNLVDLTLRQSISLLQSIGLKIGKLIYIDDMAEDAILQQIFEDNTIESGTLIHKGSSIDLILGKGNQERTIAIPFLIGQTRNNVKNLLLQHGLNIGEEIFPKNADSSSLRVYETLPPYTDKRAVAPGTTIDIRYLSDLEFNFPQYIEELQLIIRDNNSDDPALIEIEDIIIIE